MDRPPSSPDKNRIEHVEAPSSPNIRKFNWWIAGNLVLYTTRFFEWFKRSLPNRVNILREPEKVRFININLNNSEIFVMKKFGIFYFLIYMNKSCSPKVARLMITKKASLVSIIEAYHRKFRSIHKLLESVRVRRKIPAPSPLCYSTSFQIIQNISLRWYSQYE